jgi:predicted nucleic acid-binding Zn finger protein
MVVVVIYNLCIDVVGFSFKMTDAYFFQKNICTCAIFFIIITREKKNLSQHYLYLKVANDFQYI